jgi:hypothetical protein
MAAEVLQNQKSAIGVHQSSIEQGSGAAGID